MIASSRVPAFPYESKHCCVITLIVDATNELGERIMASPAVSGNALFLRTDKALYRIENPR